MYVARWRTARGDGRIVRCVVLLSTHQWRCTVLRATVAAGRLQGEAENNPSTGKGANFGEDVGNRIL